MIEFLEPYQLTKRYDSDFTNKVFNELNNKTPIKLTEGLKNYGVEQLYEIRDIQFNENEYFDVYCIKLRFDSIIKFLVFPLIYFYNQEQRVKINLTTYEFNRLPGGINQILIESFRYPSFVDDKMIFIDFQNDHVRQLQDGEINYIKYFKIIPGRDEIYILKEFENWYKINITNKKFRYLNFIYNDEYPDMDILYSKFYESKEKEFEEDIDTWEEIRGIYYDENQHEENMRQMNEDGYSDFGETGYWNTE